MATVLPVVASPRGERSYSRRVARAFLEAYRRQSPEDKTVDLDLSTAELPTIDGLVLQAKYNLLHGRNHTTAQRRAWSEVEAVIDRFKAADKYVFSLPMWNFGIPYILKNFFELLFQPGYTFAFDPKKGFSGLLTAKPVAAIYARGGEYSAPD